MPDTLTGNYGLKKIDDDQTVYDDMVTEMNYNLDRIDALFKTNATNISLLDTATSGKVEFSDSFLVIADNLPSGSFKVVFTVTPYTFGTYGTYNAMIFIARRYFHRYILALANNGRIFTRTKLGDDSSWSDWNRGAYDV